MNLCRACLSSDKDLFISDDHFVCNYNLLTNLNVKPLDGKSQQFCQNCIETVNYFIDFRNKCISAESTLQELGSNQEVKSEKLLEDSLLVKGEIKNEQDDFSYEVEFDADDDKPQYHEDEYEIKIGKNYDLPTKKTRKQHRKKKSICKKIKKEKCPDNIIISDRNYLKKITEKSACGLCGKLFKDAATLNGHLESHRAERRCRLCAAADFEHWPQLLAHRVLHTVKSQHCHLCGQKFRSHTHLEFHYWKVHCGKKDATVTCSHCPRKFTTPRNLNKHIWSSHSDKQYVCDLCSKVFNNKQKLKIHIIGHGNVRRFVCDLCGYSSKFRAGLHAHNIRKHSPQKCICKICQNPFANPEKLAKHVCTEKSKICPICGKSLRHGFARHMASHGPERRFACARCPATYRSPAAFKAHNDKHDNNPTQRCDVCHKRFYSPSVLVKHRRVHTGEKPYACKKCHMRFTGNNNLKVHMKVHGEMLIVKKNSEPEATTGVKFE